MRLISITVRNYRVHREIKVDLDPARTLIGGPNESGKSTLIEAAHRALFLKSKITGETQRSMVSTLHNGVPEVEVEFESAGQRYKIFKRFSGSSGLTTLTHPDGHADKADLAETRLAEILRVETTGGGRGAGERTSMQWAHLWVWQGQSGNDPAELADTQKDALLSRLQAQGGGAAMQSEFDAKIGNLISQTNQAIFTNSGTPRRDSDLSRAIEAEAAAQAALSEARQSFEKLEKAMKDQREAEATLLNTHAAVEKLKLQSQDLNRRIEIVNKLRLEEADRRASLRKASGDYDSLNQSNAQIIALAQDIQTRETNLQPKADALSKLAEAVDVKKALAAEADRAFQQAGERLRAVRLAHDLTIAHRVRFERAEQYQSVAVRAAQARDLKSTLAEIQKKLADLSPVTPKNVKALQKLEGQIHVDKAALDAMAAGIELLASDEPANLGNTPLQLGESRVITEDSEITIGSSIRLRIRPGGGSTLTEAREKVRDSQRKLTSALDELGITSTTAAAEILMERQALESDLQACNAKLSGLGADQLERDLAKAEHDIKAAEADVARRSAFVKEFQIPLTIDLAKTLESESRDHLEQAEAVEQSAATARAAATGAFTKAEEDFNAGRTRVDEENRAIANIKAQLQFLVNQHGNQIDRAEKLKTLLALKTEAEGRLAATTDSLAALQPETLDADKERIQRSVDVNLESRREAENKLAVARNTLSSDGVSDPQEKLAFAEAAVRAAAEHRAAIQRRADALRLLHELFQNEQRALADRFTQPLAQKITGYLEYLFGRGARANVKLEDNAFTALELIRPGQSPCNFLSLSGGAREQVAAATRLAMAQVLAENYDGCLPIVFDDAFAYSDPERVTTLQRMLDLAARNGLQIIILTCTPADYSPLGAKTISI